MPVSSGASAQNSKDTKESHDLLEQKADPLLSDFTGERPMSLPHQPTGKEARHMNKVASVVGGNKLGKA